MRIGIALCALLACLGVANGEASKAPFLIVLGIAQDGGVPQFGSNDHPAWKDPSLVQVPTSLGLVDPHSGKRWLFEATPAIKRQLHLLQQAWPRDDQPGLDGVFVTHAHVGHYTGLMFFGHEILGARHVPVHVMPRLGKFLTRNGPWDQLIRYQNIELKPLAAEQANVLTDRLKVTPFLVPHRQEYAEVVGFRIEGSHRRVLFIPDIDSWEQWAELGIDLSEQIRAADIALLDGTFYADGEVPGRDMSGFPHPRIVATMERLKQLPASQRAKVRFIHLNHTNPALRPDSRQRREIEAQGFAVAMEGERHEL